MSVCMDWFCRLIWERVYTYYIQEEFRKVHLLMIVSSPWGNPLYLTGRYSPVANEITKSPGCILELNLGHCCHSPACLPLTATPTRQQVWEKVLWVCGCSVADSHLYQNLGISSENVHCMSCNCDIPVKSNNKKQNKNLHATNSGFKDVSWILLLSGIPDRFDQTDHALTWNKLRLKKDLVRFNSSSFLKSS